MTREHIASLYFEGRAEAAKKRMQKLVSAGLIRERPRRPSESAILYLSKKGFDSLDAQGVVATYPQQGWKLFQKRVRVSDKTIRHELDIMSVKAAVVDAISRVKNLRVAEFSTWPKLYEFRARKPVGSNGITKVRDVLIKPDGFLRIHEQRSEEVSEHAYFLEVDRGSEVQQTLANKAVGYRDYYKKGGFAKRCGYDPNAPAACPFRVLMTFRTAERRNNAAERLLQLMPPIKGQVWLTTMEEIIANPLGAIWTRPTDYAQVTAGTPYDPRRRDATDSYRRDTSREMLVENKIEKHEMLG